jgi:hypothetical protein
LRLLERDWESERMPGVVGADFWAIYEVRGVVTVPSIGEGGSDASSGYAELRGARERLWRFG